MAHRTQQQVTVLALTVAGSAMVVPLACLKTKSSIQQAYIKFANQLDFLSYRKKPCFSGSSGCAHSTPLHSVWFPMMRKSTRWFPKQWGFLPTIDSIRYMIIDLLIGSCQFRMPCQCLVLLYITLGRGSHCDISVSRFCWMRMTQFVWPRTHVAMVSM